LEWFIKRVFDSVHEVCRIPAGAGGIRHSVALAIKDYPVIFIPVVPHPNPPRCVGEGILTIINNPMKIPNGLSIGKVWRGGLKYLSNYQKIGFVYL
jgi:hypothetical protein